MTWLVVFIVAVVVTIMFPKLVICAVKSPFAIIHYLLKDGLSYVIHKQNLLAKTGEIIAFVGYFGRGKTLSAVHWLRTVYRAHNNVRVYCPRRKKWVTQIVHIVSNVHINGIVYENLVSLEQVILSTDRIRKLDDENDTLTATYVLIDEAGSELSHRDFMKNINSVVLNSILTCRHWNMSLVWTSQDYMLVDKLLRKVTLRVHECYKMWRFMLTTEYNGRDIERAENTANIKSIGSACWFVKDKDYKAYDTYGSVEKLKKDIEEGNMMSDAELEALGVGSSEINMDVVNISKKYKKKVKKLY